MAKPCGPRCDLRCGYCYYVGNETALRGPGPGAKLPGRMSEAMLESYIAQRLAMAGASGAHFEWHGGEATLLGLDYFKAISRIQRRLKPDDLALTNGLQTNGLSMNGAWADFLASEGWSVGLSLDGPAGIHDKYRRSADGKPTQERVLRAYEILGRAGVFVNLLCVVTEASAGRPEELYSFFRGIGARYLQFLPLVTPARREAGRGPASPHPAAAEPAAYGDFLCRTFELWIESGVGSIVVQNFDEALRPIYGMPHALCVHSPECGKVVVLERDGSLYACDHFVDGEHFLGVLGERSLAELLADPRLSAFGAAKRGTLPRRCRECEHLASCNGGCPKDRIAPSSDGEGAINRLCPAYERFFAASRPALEALAAHMKAGRALKAFRFRSPS
jgi:uncharacterized protein